MLNLLAKDFKLIFARKDDLKKQILSSLFVAMIMIALIAIETFIFQVILKKIKNFYQAPITFLTLFLFIISVLMMIFMMIQAKKLFFNPLDMEQLHAHPISNGQIIASKLIFLFLMHYVTSLLFTYPLFISYGLTFYKAKVFYYVALFYPLLSFLFEMGIALIFVYPLKKISDWLKKHIVIQFGISIIFIFLLTFLYSKVLSVFIQLVASNQLNSIFSEDFIQQLLIAKKYFIPSNFLAEAFINGNQRYLFLYLLIGFGVFSLGLIVSILSFNYDKNSIHSLQLLKKEHTIKIMNSTKALIKKELILLFKDSGYILSFTGLLVVQPFLAYLVIHALNTIFRSGTFSYYLTMLPNFIPLIDILLIMLFSLIISQGANHYITMENKNIRLMKIIPISLFKQLGVKVLLPFTLSIVSLVVTILTLGIGKVISWNTAFFAFILTSAILAIFDIVSLYEELHIKRNKPRNIFMSSLYSYLLPVIYFVITIVLSYFGLSIYLVYLLGLLGLLLASLPYTIHMKKKVASLFLEMEMVN